ncbi:MAG: ABC transporter ATP-binding protein [Polyangiaceae bacterium]
MSEPAVEARGLCKTYRQGQHDVVALGDVDLVVEPGELTALAGPSGSGKTTLLNLIGALDRPTSGSIRVGGKDLSAMSKAELARMRRDHIGFVFQAYNLLPVLSALENAELVLELQGTPREECRERASEVLRAVGLGDMLGRRPAELSGGQQQRVAVARAIASARTLVLADEPTANLDSKSAESLLDLMVELNHARQLTFLFSTHDPRVMARARRIVHLEDGRVVEDELR